MVGVGVVRKTFAVSYDNTYVQRPLVGSCSALSTGFAVFFSIFELTRRAAMKSKVVSYDLVRSHAFERYTSDSVRKHTPRVMHAMTLVAGGAIAGLAYELTCRPWDIARKAVHIDRLNPISERHSIASILLRKLRNDGILSYFRDPNHVPHHVDPSTSAVRRRLYLAARTLARVGPWGVGFLVWEALGPGIA